MAIYIIQEWFFVFEDVNGYSSFLVHFVSALVLVDNDNDAGSYRD